MDMRTVSVYDFRNNLADYLSLVELSGSRVMVKRFKKPVAMLVPVDKQMTDFKRFFGFMGRGESGAAFLRRVRRSKKERDWVKRYG